MSEPTRLITTADYREPVDLDRVQELVVAVGSFLLYVAGVIGGAFALGAYFGAWVGFLLLIVCGFVPGAYSLRKASARRAERDRHAVFEASRERTREPAIDIPTLG